MIKALRTELTSRHIDPDVACDLLQQVEWARSEAEMRAAMQTFKTTYPAVMPNICDLNAHSLCLQLYGHRWPSTPRRRVSMKTSGLAGRTLAAPSGSTWEW